MNADMDIITKKDFIDIITSHESIQIGNTRKKIFPYDTLEGMLVDVLDMLTDGMYRTCKKQGRYIIFNNNSRLDINNNDFNKYTCYIYRYNACTILASECKWYDSCDNEWYYQTLYYIIK